MKLLMLQRQFNKKKSIFLPLPISRPLPSLRLLLLDAEAAKLSCRTTSSPPASM